MVISSRMAVGGTVRICQPRPQVREMLSITELDKLFEVYPDVESALESFR